MPKTSFRISGGDALKERFDKLAWRGAVRQAKVRVALRAGGLIALNDAKRRAAYRTGTLRRSIAMEDGPGLEEISIGTDVEYAPFVEFGTSRMAARPYLRPAIDENIAAIRREIGDTLWQLIGDAS